MPGLPYAAPPPPPEKTSMLPSGGVILGVVAIVFLGVCWTAHNRAAREKAQSADVLNEINNAGTKKRIQLRQEAAAAQRASFASRVASQQQQQPVPLPAGLDESVIRKSIESCPFFQERVTVDIPKKFQVNLYSLMLERYPAIPIAVNLHLIEFDPPFDTASGARRLPNPVQPGDEIHINIVPYAREKMDVFDVGETYQFGIGRRRVDTITSTLKNSDSSVGVGFNWNFEWNAGANLAPEGSERSGGADLQLTAAGWQAQRVWRNSYRGSTVVCGQ